METLPLKNKTILVTGATSGIGLVTAQTLAAMGATLVLVGRNPEKVKQTVDQIRGQSVPGQVEGMVADLSVQADIRRLSEEFHQRYATLDVLVNNAGALFIMRKVSTDGFEMTFALNHLNYFLLTHLLMDRLQAAPKARIVNVSSAAHVGAVLNFNDLQNEHGYTSWKAYGQSKLDNIYFTYELARKLGPGSPITVNALHPGLVATNFGRSNGGIFNPIMRLVQMRAISPEQGAQTSIYLASAPEVEGVTGQYFDKSKAVRSSPASYDEEAASHLWELSLEYTGLKTPVSA
jgi:NAD(P)-dependent dehydrogenase (short-subunit alcohol dehydrogenase family)